MWISDVILCPGNIGPGALPVAEFLRATGATPSVVVDGRSYDARGTATATYRLMKDLGLEHACPVACWSIRADAAHDHLVFIMRALAPNDPVLIVVASTGPTACWGAALVTSEPVSSSVHRLARPADDGLPGNGFLTLIVQAAAGEPSADT